MSGDDVSLRLRQLLRPVDTGEEQSIDQLRERLPGIIRSDQADAVNVGADIPRRLRRPRTVVLGLACALALGGVAVAAAPAVVERLFPDEQPVVQAVSDFRVVGDPITTEEFEAVKELNAIPSPGVSTGRSDGQDWTTVMSLASASEARILGDEHVGRWVVVPSRDGSNACATYSYGDVPAPGVGGKCGMRFRQSGLIPAMSWIGDGPKSPLAYTVVGIAADGVDDVSIDLSNGETQPVPIANNAFRWTGSKGQVPCALSAVRMGQQVREVLEGPPNTGCKRDTRDESR